nr:integrase, catalytic region, zinc finger, CCHC-type, peptidase aspartic, catalytic [Tanacetum cinerariifolium]
NKKQEFVKSDDKKDEEKKRDMRKVKCYNCKKEGHFAKDCKKAKVKDYRYYKTKMLLAKKDKDEQVLLAKDYAWMESNCDSDHEINANMICLWIIDSGCSKHMTGNHTLLTNFVEKFLGTVRFENTDFVMIAGYGDVVIGSMMIKRVYYVEGLGHNLFSICLWIIDSGCSKHMTGNRALLTNFVEKFLRTVRFGNNDFAVIAGYGDVVIGSMTIMKHIDVRIGIDLPQSLPSLLGKLGLGDGV